MRIAAAPVSWGVFEVTLTAEVPSADLFLDDVIDLGYAGTESGPPGYLGVEPASARRRLDDRGLDLVGTFLPYDFADPAAADANISSLRRALDFVSDSAPLRSSPVIILSDDYQRQERMAVAGRAADHPEIALPPQQWPGFCASVNQMAAICADEGFTVAFHPHVGSYVETPEEIDRLISGLDPSKIGLCMDIGHVTFGGGDALALTRQYSQLIRHVHAKDVNLELLERILQAGKGLKEAWELGVFCDLGEGAAQVSECLESLDTSGYAGWIVVEQDRLPTGRGFLEGVRRSQRHNREFLAGLGW